MALCPMAYETTKHPMSGTVGRKAERYSPCLYARLYYTCPNTCPAGCTSHSIPVDRRHNMSVPRSLLNATILSYIDAYTYVYTHVYTHAYTHKYAQVYMHVYTHMPVCISAHAYAHACCCASHHLHDCCTAAGCAAAWLPGTFP